MNKKLFILITSILGCAQSGLAMEEVDQDSLNKQLYAAILKAEPTKVEKLLAAGADANGHGEHPYNNTSETPFLALAVHKKNYEICKLLLEHGADVNNQTHWNNSTVLFYIFGRNYRYHLWVLGANLILDMQDNKYISQMHRLLFEYGANIEIKNNDQVTPLMAAAGHKNELYCNLLITLPVFNPTITAKQFKESRERIFTALLAFHRCEKEGNFNLPLDVRRLILCALPELKIDFINSAACGIAKIIKEKQAHTLPLTTLRVLIQNEKLDPEKTVAAIKANHITCIKPLMQEAAQIIQKPGGVWEIQDAAAQSTILALVNPETCEEKHGAEIEKNIRERLGLPSQSSCVMQ